MESDIALSLNEFCRSWLAQTVSQVYSAFLKERLKINEKNVAVWKTELHQNQKLQDKQYQIYSAAIRCICLRLGQFRIINWVGLRKLATVKNFKADVPSVALRQSYWWRANSRNASFKTLQWPVYVINSADNRKLPYYTLPPTQHHSFPRSLLPCCPLLLFCVKAANESLPTPQNRCHVSDYPHDNLTAMK